MGNIGNLSGIGKMESGDQKYLLSLTFNTDNKIKIFVEVDVPNITTVAGLTDYVKMNGLTSYYDGDGSNETEKVVPTLTIPVLNRYGPNFAIPYMLKMTKLSETTWGNLSLIMAPGSGTSFQGMTISQENWSLAYE